MGHSGPKKMKFKWGSGGFSPHPVTLKKISEKNFVQSTADCYKSKATVCNTHISLIKL